MARMAENVLKDIRENPERHRHTFSDLLACCTIDGMLDMLLMDAYSQLDTGANGGIRCDVTSGPCACGAWH